MIVVHCALMCEAKPIVDQYGLKQVLQKPFRIYANKKIYLLVSGLGKTNTAVALGIAYGMLSKTDSAWLNVGIAGSGNAAIGQIILVNKNVDVTSGDVWYPPQIWDFDIPQGELHTLEKPSQDYLPNIAYDMEAAGFFEVATKFSTSELVQSIKVVSDNKLSGIDKIDKAYVENLILECLPLLSSVIDKMNSISEDTIALQDDVLQLDSFFDKWHFSVSQQTQLRKVLQRFKVVFPDRDLGPEDFLDIRTSRALIQHIAALVDKHPIIF